VRLKADIQQAIDELGVRIDIMSPIRRLAADDDTGAVDYAYGWYEAWTTDNAGAIRKLFKNPTPLLNKIDEFIFELDYALPRYDGKNVGRMKRLYKQQKDFLNQIQEFLEGQLDELPEPKTGRKPRAKGTQHSVRSREVFVVHGHDNEMKLEVAHFLESLSFKPIILHEQASQGRNILEKFKAHANVAFAVVLLSPDDIGYPKSNESNKEERARQNVILELGYFLGSLGQAHVCALNKGNTTVPSDYHGIVYIPFEGNWKDGLRKELEAAGLVD
jgi:predicted nucleotide-binding protein